MASNFIESSFISFISVNNLKFVTLVFIVHLKGHVTQTAEDSRDYLSNF